MTLLYNILQCVNTNGIANKNITRIHSINLLFKTPNRKSVTDKTVYVCAYTRTHIYTDIYTSTIHNFVKTRFPLRERMLLCRENIARHTAAAQVVRFH